MPGKWQRRIEQLKAARRPFLDFLRNLGPQVLLLTLVELLGTRLDFTRWDINNIPMTSVFYTFLLAFVAAVAANATLLYEEAFGELLQWRAAKHLELKAQGFKAWKYGKAMWEAMFRERFLEFITYLYLILFFQVMFAGTVATSIASAANLFHLPLR